MHHNERGSHTTVIEKGQVVLDIFSKRSRAVSIEVAPGKIEAGIKAKSSSVKFKHINDELYEMVVTHNSSRQEFKVFTRASIEELQTFLKEDKHTRDWNCGYTDMREANYKKTPSNLDAKYSVVKK